jgi:hypothetical protein
MRSQRNNIIDEVKEGQNDQRAFGSGVRGTGKKTSNQV